MVRLFSTYAFVVFLTVLSFDVCGQFVELSESQVEQLPDDTAKVNRLIGLGKKYCAANNRKALYYLQESLYIANQIGYTQGIAWSYLYLGRVYYYKDEYDLAGTNLRKAKKLLDEMNDPFGLAFYFFALGSISNLRGNHVNAIDEFQQAMHYSRLAGNKLYESGAAVSLGSIHHNRGEHDQAMKYFRESLAIKNKINDQKGIANIYNGIGSIKETKQQYDSALYYYKKGFEIRKARGSIRAIANSLISVAKIEISTGKYKDAIEKLEQALTYYTELDEKTGACYAKINLARALNYAGNTEMAMNYLSSVLISAKQMNNPRMVLDCYKIQAEMESVNGNFQNAYQLSVKSNKLQDSLNKANREEIIQEMEARFSLEQKNNEIENLSNRNSIQQKNIIILSLSIGALVLIMLLLVFLFRLKARDHKRQSKLLEQEKTIMEQEEKIKEKEMQLLQESVESKNRELATKAIEMLRINETIGEVINKLEVMKSDHAGNQKIANHIREIARDLENQTNTNTWREFDKIFKNIHTGFYDHLLKECPVLTASEIKIAALLKLNLSTKEIAAITYKTEEGIKSTRYRLRKKLKLSGDDKLVPYLMKL